MQDEHKNNTRSDKNIFLLPFSLIREENETHFCLNVQKIYTVIEGNHGSRLPGHLDPFSFLMDVQGMPVPILNLDDLVDNNHLDFVQKPQSNLKKRNQNSKRIIVCHFLNIYLGICVDSTKKIMIQLNENILPPPAIWDSNENFFVSGLIKENDHYRYLFDIEKYIHKKGIQTETLMEKTLPSFNVLEGKKTLIIEDSAVYQLMIKRSLEKYGVLIESAKDGKEGLKCLLEKGEQFDFIISDIEMPFMNGIEMIRQYRQSRQLPHTPVIFHSAISNENLSLDIENEKLGIYLSKFNEGELLKTIINLLYPQ